MSKGVQSIGITCPVIRKGDDLAEIVLSSIFRTTSLQEGDIIGITESVVARAYGNYVTVDEIAQETVQLFGENPTLVLMNPIYSRNRFSMILKGIARAAKCIYFNMPEYDEVGNPSGVNPWTGVNITEYYTEICKSEKCKCFFGMDFQDPRETYVKFLDCSLRPHLFGDSVRTLKDFFPEKCEYGLLGSNKANEELVKLFPNKEQSQALVDLIQETVKSKLGINVEVMIYGDGCFKDPDSGIWEFADPVCAPAYTAGLEGHPNEIKLKAFADNEFKDLNGKQLDFAIKTQICNKKTESVKNEMRSQGTTPRRYVNLLASLMDLTSGSGDKGTPVVIVKNYFKNYADA